MQKIDKEAIDILDVSQKIYQIQEYINPTSILGDKRFVMGTENNPEHVLVKRDWENMDSSYYFETSEIEGVIVKKKSGDFCVKASVSYTNADEQNFWFAKIRIENSRDQGIVIKGGWDGSWQQPDYEDENIATSNSLELAFALDSMKVHLNNIYNQLRENGKLNRDLYDPAWVQKIKKYNTQK